jgi:hypothetical protein
MREISVVVSLISFSIDVFLSHAECSDDVHVGVSIGTGNRADGCSSALYRTDCSGILLVTTGFVIGLRFTVYVKPVGWFGSVYGMEIMVTYGILCHPLFILKNSRPFCWKRSDVMRKLRTPEEQNL